MIYTATFDIPNALKAGLESGEYKLLGGHVRDSAGRIIALLREVGPGQQALQGVAQSSLQALQLTATVGLGLQVLSLGVTVAGFVILSARLKKIEGRLVGIERRLDRLTILQAETREDVRTLLMFARSANIAKALAALDTARRGEKQSSRNLMESARHSLLEAEHNARQVVLRLAAMTGWEESDFRDYVAIWVICSAARRRLEALLDGLLEGASGLRELHQEIADVRNAFVTSFENRKGPDRSEIASDKSRRAILIDMSAFLVDLSEHIESYAIELEFCERNNLTLAEWSQIGSDATSPGIMIIAPTSSAQINW